MIDTDRFLSRRSNDRPPRTNSSCRSTIVSISSDLTSWTSSQPIPFEMYSLCYVDSPLVRLLHSSSIYVAIGANIENHNEPAVVISTDGIEWSFPLTVPITFGQHARVSYYAPNKDTNGFIIILAGRTGMNYISQDAIHWSAFTILDESWEFNIKHIVDVCGGYIGDVHHYAALYRREGDNTMRLAVTTNMKVWKCYPLESTEMDGKHVMCCGDGVLMCLCSNSKSAIISVMRDANTEPVTRFNRLVRRWVDVAYGETEMEDVHGNVMRRGVFVIVSDDGWIECVTSDLNTIWWTASPFMMMNRVVRMGQEDPTFVITRMNKEGDNTLMTFRPSKSESVDDEKIVMTVPFDMKNTVMCVGDGKVVVANAGVNANEERDEVLKIIKLNACSSTSVDVGMMVDGVGMMVDDEQKVEMLMKSGRLYVVTRRLMNGYVIVKSVRADE